jgi:hypothetical protein
MQASQQPILRKLVNRVGNYERKLQLVACLA